jgi:uncharacterized protein YbjT (DUF2867 family)
MHERYLVLGATGLVGGLVLHQLASEGRDVLGATRRPGSARQVRLDLLDEASFQPALADVTTVMLMSRPGDEEAHRVAQPFIAAMRQAGVRHVVVLSALGAQRRPEFSLRKVELLVEHSGMSWTHIRPNFFMQTLALPPLAAEIANQGTLSLPLGDAAIAYVDARDVACVVHRALVDPGLVGRGIDVNGPDAWTHDALMEVLSLTLGRPLRYVGLDEDEARALMRARRFPPLRIERVLSFYRLIRQGFCAHPDAELGALLGRPLTAWSDFVRVNRGAWIPHP